MSPIEWSREQLAMLDAAGVPEAMRQSFGMLGTAEWEIDMAVWNILRGSHWPEITHTPLSTELRLWRLPLVEAGTIEGERTFLDPSMWGAERPKREPDQVFFVDARVDNEEMGVQLAVAVWRWLRDHEPSFRIHYAEEIAAWEAKQAEGRESGDA
jgi:hypothetical protein